MSKHTPGPWAVEPILDKFNVYLLDESCLCIARDCTEANARLISSAPDLLTELRFVLKGIDGGHVKCAPYFDFDPDAAQIEFKSVGDRLRAVIAKAEGTA